jgi:hypothetical protein
LIARCKEEVTGSSFSTPCLNLKAFYPTSWLMTGPAPNLSALWRSTSDLKVLCLKTITTSSSTSTLIEQRSTHLTIIGAKLLSRRLLHSRTPGSPPLPPASNRQQRVACCHPATRTCITAISPSTINTTRRQSSSSRPSRDSQVLIQSPGNCQPRALSQLLSTVRRLILSKN